ncbi:MAG: TetR/AcrR family transcriptional regulator [Hyphomicrobiales bacterium]|nr:TetR/AcrR family transcriptional regulator [Hyphomicrobiales bacterium]MCP5371894.1 TetR/AcrR family transcriptional regulator [Hyphomicrobiales bacterium]
MEPPVTALSPRPRGRPPRPAAARDGTRARLVRRGIEVLTEKGFASTGIDEILRREGVPKGSFYHYFASKDDFGAAVIDGYADYFAAKLDRWLLEADRAPLDRLRDFVADARAGMARHGFRRGCLIGNLGQEMGATHDDFRRRLAAVFADWQARVAACLEAAKAAGELAPEADCDRLAAFFWIGWEGAILRAKLVRSARPVDLFADTFFAGLPRQST